MAFLVISFLTLATVYVCGGIQRNVPGNFPIDGCSTEQMDVLFLYFDNLDQNAIRDQKTMAFDFADSMLGFREIESRVLFAGVYDSYSVSESTVNVSSWKFYDADAYVTMLDEELYDIFFSDLSFMYITDPYKKYHNSVNNNLTQKIRFVQRLFAEMRGSRKNVTHVAVIVLNGGDLSFEETRDIPHILDQQKQGAGIKILVVVFYVRYVSHIVYLRDTILVGYDRKELMGQVLVMAICNQCSDGWFKFDESDHMSCYFVLDSTSRVNWELTRSWCDSDVYTSMVAIETKEELLFLQTKMLAYLKDNNYLIMNTSDPSRLTAYIYIGLKRDTTTISKRFHWSRDKSKTTSPLVVNHWLPWKPSGGFSNGCGVWLFTYNISNDVINTSIGDNLVVDGWTDVKCRDKVSFLGLCEATFPCRNEDKNMITIKPARNESFSQALTKGYFMIFKDNIVSISANIGNGDFFDFLRKSEKELFPIFDCGEEALGPRYISYVYVCDSFDHCSNRRDEVFCFYKSEGTSRPAGDGVYCCDDSFLPIRWVGDGEVDCNVCGYSSYGNEVNDENEDVVRSEKRGKICAFYCSNECVRFKDLNNNKSDCHGFEGEIDETIGKLKAIDNCYNRLGHRLWAPKCVYLKDMYGALIGCRDMSHLDNCKDFECPEDYVKCPNNYCIPQHYVFDGTLDCPTGDDEYNYTTRSCTGNFACWNSKMCLHPELVCDGKPDCPHEDDEVDCHMKCVQGFRCISGTVTVSDYNRSLLIVPSGMKFDRRTRYLDLSGVELSDAGFYELNSVLIIIFSHCNLTNGIIYDEFLPNGLQILDLSYNRLQSLNGIKMFDSPLDNVLFLNLSHNKGIVEMNNFNFKFLETLDLSHTSMSLLDKSFIVMFSVLKHLNVSFTQISGIHRNTFPHNIIYQSLDLRGLFIADFYEDYFSGLSISHDLFTDSFQLCCPQIRGNLIPYHTCHAPDDAISSCFDLIGIDVQRVLLWVVAVLAVLGNMTVIGYRVIWDRAVLTTGYGLFVTNVGISDFIMGVYLFIIAGADYYYRDVYVLYDKIWRESGVCKIAGFLATLSCETSTLFVFLITLDRFMILKFPYGQVQFSQMSKIIVLFLSWITGFLLALTPIVFRFEIYSSNAMCLGLPLTTKRLNGWQFSFAVFIALNLSLVLLIVYGQRAIFRAMSENRINNTASRRASDLTVAKQLLLVALSNFLCWFPVGIMGLLSLGGHMISNDVFAWTTILVLPINSAANPLLYTIPAIMVKWERFKHGEGRNIDKST